MTDGKLFYAVAAAGANLLGAVAVTWRVALEHARARRDARVLRRVHDRRGAHRPFSGGARERRPRAAIVALAGYLAVHVTQHVIGAHFHFGEETHAVSEAVSVSALVGLLLHTFVDGVAVASGWTSVARSVRWCSSPCSSTRCPKGWPSRACSSRRRRAAGARSSPPLRSAPRPSWASADVAGRAAARSWACARGGGHAVRRHASISYRSFVRAADGACRSAFLAGTRRVLRARCSQEGEDAASVASEAGRADRRCSPRRRPRSRSRRACVRERSTSSSVSSTCSRRACRSARASRGAACRRCCSGVHPGRERRRSAV